MSGLTCLTRCGMVGTRRIAAPREEVGDDELQRAAPCGIQVQVEAGELGRAAHADAVAQRGERAHVHAEAEHRAQSLGPGRQRLGERESVAGLVARQAQHAHELLLYRGQGRFRPQVAFAVEQLGEVDTDGVEPLRSVMPIEKPWRADAVTDGGRQAEIVQNAPAAHDGYFVVPKVVE